MIPNRRTSPGPSERLTASVSACASIATNRISFFIDQLLSHVALRYVGLPTRSVTYVLRIGVGRSILTRMSFTFPPCRLTLPAGRRSLPSHAGVRYFAHAHRPAGSDGPGE